MNYLSTIKLMINYDGQKRSQVEHRILGSSLENPLFLSSECLSRLPFFLAGPYHLLEADVVCSCSFINVVAWLKTIESEKPDAGTT